MKNIVLSIMVVSTLLAAGIGGTFAGFVDTEESMGNSFQAGILDLLVNGKNDPDVMGTFTVECGVPCSSIDKWIDLYNWGQCQGAWVYMHFKDVVSEEYGTKKHNTLGYVYDGVSTGITGIPDGYRVAEGTEPKGPGVWSSEPEKIAEVGGGWVGQTWVPDNHPCLLGEDYASGISEHLGITVRVPLVGATGQELGNPDTDGNGDVDATEEGAWQTAGNRWAIIADFSGKLSDIECNKNLLGILYSQTKTFVHIHVHLQQIECPDWPEPQTRYWPTNALQGDRATWNMLFELNTDVPGS